MGESEIQGEDQRHENSQSNEHHDRVVRCVGSAGPCYLTQLDVDLVEELPRRCPPPRGPRRRSGTAGLGRLRAPPGRCAVLGHLALALHQPPLLSVHAHDGSSWSLGGGFRENWGLREEVGFSGSRAGGTRTPNRRFWRPVLYQLSYCPLHGCCGWVRPKDSTRRRVRC